MAGALIGALRVSLSAETSAFEAGMKRSQRTAQTTANSITSSFKTAGGAMGALKAGVAGFIASLSVGTIIAAGKAALDYAGSLAEVAQQLGVTTKDLQVFRFAAGQVGVSQEQLETGLGKLTITLGNLANGAKAPREALEGLQKGLSEAVRGKDTGEAFRLIADALSKVTDRAQRASVEVALFGRSGAKLDNLLSGGSKQVNELADAAQQLGIVLSDEQIQKADDTADKLEALSTVLKAKIAGEVADNASSILQLADALIELVNTAQRASAAWVDFTTNLARKWSIPAQLDKFINGSVFGFDTAGKSVTVPLNGNKQADSRFGALFRGRPGRGGASVGNFLASGGGGSRRGGGGRDRSAEEAQRKLLDNLRDQQQFDQEILRAKQDILQSQRSLATNGDDRANIDLELLASDRRQFESQMAYERKVFDITNGADGISEAQAEQKRQLYDINENLQQQAIEQEQQRESQRQVARLADVDFDLQREKLELEAGLAKTASEQRDVQLRLLDLWYRQERAKLDAIMAEEAIGSAAWEEARRRKAALDANQAARAANVKAGTRSPLEEYAASLPLDAGRMNEALENVAVNGLKGLEQGLMDIIDGTKSVKDAFHDMAAAILADLLRIAIQKYVIGTILNLAGVSGAKDGGLVPGFAYGGFVSGPGGSREDRVPAMLSNGEFVINAKSTKKFLPLLEAINNGVPHMAMGGLAIARPSIGPRIDVSNVNHGMGRMPSIVMNNDFRGADPAAVAAITMKLNKMEAEFPGRVVATMSDAKDRFIWRGDRR